MYRLIVQYPQHVSMITFDNYEAGVKVAKWLSILPEVHLLGVHDTNDERKGQYHKDRQWWPKERT